MSLLDIVFTRDRLLNGNKVDWAPRKEITPERKAPLFRMVKKLSRSDR